MHWRIPKMWTEDCWIIGGGPSMLHQFGVPSDVIGQVREGKSPYSVYGDYLSPIHSKNVIGTNLAFMLGDWVSVMYFCDAQFLRKYIDKVLTFRNLKVTCVNQLGGVSENLQTNIKRLKRDYRSGLSTKPDTIQWNHNSGAAAINFASLAGAKRILLLGFDMVVHPEGTHWHNLYGKQTPPNSFKRFMRNFPKIAEDAKKLKVEILNVSPTSALDVFPKVALKDVL